jgi:hypothetical protein
MKPPVREQRARRKRIEKTQTIVAAALVRRAVSEAEQDLAAAMDEDDSDSIAKARARLHEANARALRANPKENR